MAPFYVDLTFGRIVYTMVHVSEKSSHGKDKMIYDRPQTDERMAETAKRRLDAAKRK